jgi:hypothetical protein
LGIICFTCAAIWLATSSLARLAQATATSRN